MTAIGPAVPGDAIAAATRGLRKAEARAADAATRIAAMGAPRDVAVEPGVAPDLTAAIAAAPDPGLAMVDLMVATRAYQANATVLRTADEMQGALLRTRA